MSDQPGAAELRIQLIEAAERERAVSEILRTISGARFDLDELLQTVIESAVRLSHAEFGNIARLDQATGRYRQAVYHGDVSGQFWAALNSVDFVPSHSTLIGRTLLARDAVQIEDVLADPEYGFSEAQQLGGYRTILGVPMLRDGFPIGVIVLNRRVVKPFSEREISLLTTFADQAVLAVSTVDLFQVVEHHREELARFAPQVAGLLSTEEGEQLLAGHRRQITAMFADLRGFTGFAQAVEPEEVLGVLRAYHSTVGEIVSAGGGTIEHFAGDGLMAFFNDPALLPDHQLVAVQAAFELRDRVEQLAEGWQKQGYDLGLGIGLASGYATLGRIGFPGRYEYGAVGNVVILASRLSDVAGPGEVLISQSLQAALEGGIESEPVDPLQLKGFSRPVLAFRAHRLIQ
jgi:class 3 adenylate cyclase